MPLNTFLSSPQDLQNVFLISLKSLSKVSERSLRVFSSSFEETSKNFLQASQRSFRSLSKAFRKLLKGFTTVFQWLFICLLQHENTFRSLTKPAGLWKTTPNTNRFYTAIQQSISWNLQIGTYGRCKELNDCLCNYTFSSIEAQTCYRWRHVRRPCHGFLNPHRAFDTHLLEF